MNAVRTVRVASVFGTVASVRALASDRGAAAVGAATDRVLADLSEIDRLCSPYRADSDVSLIDRGELAVANAHPRVQAVAELCEVFRIRSSGRFDASWRGGFDPTGLVKGWAVERAALAHLAPLVEPGTGVEAVGITVGGDMRLFTADASPFTWQIGIVDPVDAGSVAATVSVRTGGVATSGTAERGAHIGDPASGRPVEAPMSATVVAASLTDADVWATVAVVAGFDDLGWIAAAPETTGLLLDPAGGSRRWLGSVEVQTSPVSAFTA